MEVLRILLAAKPVIPVATEDARSKISGMSRTRALEWATPRLGITNTYVYMAPSARRQRGNLSGRRRKFGNLIVKKSFIPAFEQKRAEIEGRVLVAIERRMVKAGFE